MSICLERDKGGKRMINYLTKYGITEHKNEFEELDINDRMELESQINGVRQRYHKLLNVMDSIDTQILENQYNISKLSKKVIEQARIENKRPNDLFSVDDEYLELEFERDALKTGKEMIVSQINFVNNDLRILNSAFYNKFQ